MKFGINIWSKETLELYLPPSSSSSSSVFSRFAPTLLITTNLFDKPSILFLFCVTRSNDRKKTCFILNNVILLKRYYIHTYFVRILAHCFHFCTIQFVLCTDRVANHVMLFTYSGHLLSVSDIIP